jgi:acetylornithine deacetylase/succinyl-diaminopimelate desuccinylase-like protein
MEAIDRYLEANRADIQERLRLLVGEAEGPAPSAQALLVALARPLADSGLLLQAPMRPGRPLVATCGDPGRRHVLLLFHLDEPESAQPGGARAGLAAALAALAALRAAEPLPLGVTLVCEQDRSRSLASLEGLGLPPVDVCLWDGGGYDGDRPWVALGSHGLVRLRLRVTGPGGPIGLGAVVANPAWRLTWALAALKSGNEEVRVPGFYDPVRSPEAEEQAALEALAPALAGALAERGAAPLNGLPAGSLALVQAFSPGVSITGLGAEAAPGQLPTLAWAELTLTLVPEQTPAGVVSALVEHLEEHGLGDVAVEVVAGYAGQTTPADSPLVALVREAAPAALGVEPVSRPYSEQPAPLARLAANGPLAAVGIGPGNAPWPELEERVVRQARLVAALLARLADQPAG